jgi:hypothetical protein
MNTLRRISAAAILSLTLALPAFAGHIETPSRSGSTSTTTSVTTYVVLTITNLIYG